jgi:uncharacterized protein (DUF1501 family)
MAKPPIQPPGPLATRRRLLGFGAAAGTALLLPPRVAFASADSEQRFVFLILRGGLDGIEAVVPADDPALIALRGRIAMENPLPLGGGFILNPSLVNLARMATAGEAVFVHAIATGYRDRSHFDAQNMLETGGNRAFEVKDGWLNRLSTSLGGDFGAVAIGDSVPVALRGKAPVASFSTRRQADMAESLQQQVDRLWSDDPLLHPLWDQAMAARAILSGTPAGPRNGSAAATLAARFLVAPDGPRLATIELDGFDTHTSQRFRLLDRMRELDETLKTLATQLGPVWEKTIVVAATEFGRTAALNGGEGTDHGTGTVAFIAGGALPAWGIKGPVVTEWPGLGRNALLDGRDLRPTRDLRALLLALTARHFQKEPDRLAGTLFPGIEGLTPDRAFL